MPAHLWVTVSNPMKATARAPVRIDLAGGWTDVHHFADREGGAVLNAAITHYVHGELGRAEGRFQVRYHTDVPPGAGLGASAALNVVWLALVNASLGRSLSRVELAEQAYRLEELLGVTGGRQDQYAAALGGVNFLRFEGGAVHVEGLSLADDTLHRLQERLVLVYSGESRLSGDIHERVWGGYLSGKTKVAAALRRLAEIVSEMREALLSGDLGSFGALLEENWRCQKDLHPSITNDTVEGLFQVAEEAGAISGKACGAGGGGCLLFWCEEGATSRVAASLAEASAQVIDFALDWEGLVVEREGRAT
jgi:D-glycero-alpha-D-manno-heptose-7-phosphate kinase